jgi:hypothetical protein
VTVPSSSQPQAIAVITPGVFQVVARMIRSSAGTFAAGGNKTDAQTGGDILESPGHVHRALRCQIDQGTRRLSTRKA